MESNTILWSVGIIAIIAFATVIIIQRIKKKLLETVSEVKTSNDLFSDNEIGSYLNSFLKALCSEDENRFLLLEKLKKNATDCLREFTDAFEKLSEGDYNAKWMIVYCISQFELPVFINLLSNIAQSEIPKEKSQNIHLYSTVSEETVIRLRAVEGLKSIAQNGIKEAETELFDLLRSKYLTLNIAACQSLMTVNGQNSKKILEILPKDKHYIIEIKRKDVKEIAVIKNPQQHVTTNVDTRKETIPKPGRPEKNHQGVSRTLENSKSPKINR